MEDLIIIGAGSAGLGAIGMAHELGWNPLVVELNEKNVGGDCLNFGCVPSKALIHLSKQFKGALEAQRYGIQLSGEADMRKILKYVHDKQAVIRTHESADYLRSTGVKLIIGKAKFINKNTIEVKGQKFQAHRFIIATGSKPRTIPLEGIDQVKLFTNETIFYDLTELPKSFLVIGGGPIGCELGQVFQRFGSAVTILNRGENILQKERPEISQVVHDTLQKEGVNIINGASLKRFANANTGIYEKEGVEKSIQFDSCLMAIGRQLNSNGMDFHTAGIQVDDRERPILNEYLQSTNTKIYFAGDAAGIYQFSHGAEKHIQLLKHNFKNKSKENHSIRDLSWVTFTDPEIATFGFTEAELKKRNIPYWRQDQDFGNDDRAIVSEYEGCRCTLFFSKPSGLFKKSRHILGGTMVAPNAGEIIQELLLAANTKMSIEHLFNKIYPYPTASRINQQTIMGVVMNDRKGR